MILVLQWCTVADSWRPSPPGPSSQSSHHPNHPIRQGTAMSVSTSPKSLVPRQATTMRLEALKRQISPPSKLVGGLAVAKPLQSVHQEKMMIPELGEKTRQIKIITRFFDQGTCQMSPFTEVVGRIWKHNHSALLFMVKLQISKCFQLFLSECATQHSVLVLGASK